MSFVIEVRDECEAEYSNIGNRLKAFAFFNLVSYNSMANYF